MTYVPEQEVFQRYSEASDTYAGGITRWSLNERRHVDGVRYEYTTDTAALWERSPDGGLRPVKQIRTYIEALGTSAHIDLRPPLKDVMDKLDYQIRSWVLSAKFASPAGADNFINLLQRLRIGNVDAAD